MKQRKNRRTLKKRIRRALNLSAFIPIVFLSGLVICLIFAVSQGFATYQVEMVSTMIEQDINSGNALHTLGIDSLDQLDSEDPRTIEWIDAMSQNETFSKFFSFTEEQKSVFVTIELMDEVLYSNEEKLEGGWADLYKQTAAKKPIYGTGEEIVGTVSVSTNAKIILAFVSMLLIAVIIFSIFALIIAKILGLFLAIPIIKPIRQLEIKVRAVSEGDIETASGTELHLKRPLREMESLADSTNVIIRRFHEYNEMLESQKQILENQKEVLEQQNAELEMQNEELFQSKSQVQQQQGQLIQSEKMASVGMLTAAITHEINTPIGAISSNAQMEDMLIQQLMTNPIIQNSEELTEIYTQIKEVNDINLSACSRIIEIIKSLKTFSRLDQAEFKEANINEGIKSVLVLTRNLLKRRINVHEDFEDLPPVKCFPGQLNQVVMNIIVNASQAIEGEGDIYIHTYQKEQSIYISIKDTGVGIKPEDITKLFDPGYTTKGVGVGLGLGLYLSYNIIQNHKGEIIVKSELGKGSEFIIRIPSDTEKT